ncbi:tRNA cyclic N6-threonylcarbamoyladenosine(37) synthase TcdA [Halioxenophilus sp. WMMB6]|uniref:tRNA cyclic N6-threonylcarbamoyladenosine(37) synthase TcdA n=1 Tax=Halioxenophilus sp. WMMB6 TaxID=3073815 RepID=UPI00295F48E9|nr:tRNA cyclic N6-threonylcarbamoyladenosine(37) synthase TcdA [Halioxenophilus sp. WMMB6]
MTFSSDYQQRFGGIARLFGQQASALLAEAHFLVLGIGGVGTWSAEALARTGVGTLTLVDLDDICITNSNRQVHTLQTTIGRAKTTVMAERLRLINPELVVHEVADFIDADNLQQIILPGHSGVLDAIDNANAKAAVIAHCKRQKLPLVSVGSAGGKRDPRAITSGDLSRTTNDPLLAKVRNTLRRHYGFSRNTKRLFSVEAVYSTEQMVYPNSCGEVSFSAEAMTEGFKLDCSSGFGAASMVTGSFGLIAASRLIDRYLQRQYLLAERQASAASD